MIALGSLVFLTPIVLIGLLALPVLWWLLRASPPSPLQLRFPGVRLLLGLVDKEKMPDRTPWWLLLLRIFAIAAAILAFADPVINPEEQSDENGPLLIVADGGWASAGDWDDRISELERQIEKAARNGRPTSFVNIAARESETDLVFKDAQDWLPEIRAMVPMAWAPDRADFSTIVAAQAERFDTIWLTDNLQHAPNELITNLQTRGTVQVFATSATVMALRPLSIDDGMVVTDVVAAPVLYDREVTVSLFGKAPNGVELRIAEATESLTANENLIPIRFELPLELRNRMTRAVIDGEETAGAIALADDGLRRRKVALIGGVSQEGPQLVDPMFYLRKALQPTVELIEGDLADALLTAPDVIILPDVAGLSRSSTAKLIEWVEDGGLLVRFAGPRLAASGLGQLVEDPLLSIRLRAGGRNLGGAMSWGSPKQLAPFPENSPFYGLSIPQDVEVSAQVVAQPSPELSNRTLSSLTDGTPLVTAKPLGDGRVVLFHVTANAEWSSLPLSGLFVQMLERLSITSGTETARAELAGRTWVPEQILDGFGDLSDPDTAVPVTGERLADETVGVDAPPGIYRSGELGVAVNTLRPEDILSTLELPSNIGVTTIGQRVEQALKPLFLLGALALLILDAIGTLFVSGRLQNMRAAHASSAVLLMLLLHPSTGDAQDDAAAIRAANDTVLAYVMTGNSEIDEVSDAGLYGLSLILSERTSIEPVSPVGVDIERDELAFYPLLYWPIREGQRDLSAAAIEKLNTFMANGGTIFFDTRDGNLGAGFGSGTTNGRILQSLASDLDIPPLTPVPEDHVLLRTFYLLQELPGRWVGPDIWVEVPTGASIDGIPFASPNDGVTPVIIGANDWAAGWAVRPDGRPMFSVGRGINGARQREMAYRFGVNLVMYIMTGNYKSDQVHVPALLERLGE